MCVSTLTLFYRWWNAGAERLRNLPKITQGVELSSEERKCSSSYQRPILLLLSSVSSHSQIEPPQNRGEWLLENNNCLSHSLPLFRLPTPSACSQRRVRPNELKRWSLEQRKVHCKGRAGRTGRSCSEGPNSLMGFREVFIGKFGERVAGCVTLLWLVGGNLTAWCSRKLSHHPSGSIWPGIHVFELSLKLPSSPWALVPVEELRDTYQIALHLPRRGTRPRPHFTTVFFLHSFILLISNCLNLSFGRSRRLKVYFLQTRNGEYGKAFMPRRSPKCPPRYQSPFSFDFPQSWGEQVLDKKGNNILGREVNKKLSRGARF